MSNFQVNSRGISHAKAQRRGGREEEQPFQRKTQRRERNASAGRGRVGTPLRGVRDGKRRGRLGEPSLPRAGGERRGRLGEPSRPTDMDRRLRGFCVVCDFCVKGLLGGEGGWDGIQGAGDFSRRARRTPRRVGWGGGFLANWACLARGGRNPSHAKARRGARKLNHRGPQRFTEDSLFNARGARGARGTQAPEGGGLNIQ